VPFALVHDPVLRLLMIWWAWRDLNTRHTD
jgi:hypothetical protein